MIIFANNLKRIFKNKLQLFLIIIIPTLFMIPITLGINSTNDSKHAPKVGIIDLDKTNFTATIAYNLAAKAKITAVPQEKIQERLITSEVDYVVVINKGFTNNLIKGEKAEVKGYYLKDSVRSIPVQKYMESYMGAAKKIARTSGGDEKMFYQGLKQYKNASLTMDYKVLAEIDRYKSYMSLGIFVMFMLFTTVLYTTLILTDKENKTFYRTITAPVTVKSYMLQNILSFLLISFIQITIILIVLKTFVGVYLGDSMFKMYLLFLAISVVCVSLGVAISSLSKSVIQASFTGLFITFPMSFLGGCWWENEMSTNLVRAIGKFTPVYWGMEGVNKLLNEQSISSISGDIFIMMLFAVVFFFFGTWRREDIMN